MTTLPKRKLVLALTDTFGLGFLKGQSPFMVNKGFDVYLFSGNGPGLENFEKNEGCKVIRLPFKRNISILNDIKSLILTIKYLRQIKPDIVNAGTPKAGLICMMACKILGIKCRIFTLRGLRSTAEPEGFSKRIVEIMEKITHMLAKKVICISPSLAEYAITRSILPKTKAVVLGRASSNGFNTDRFNPNNKKSLIVQQLKREFGITDEDFVLGFVGRIVKSKGVEDLFEAFELLSRKYNNIKFLITGPIEDHSDAVDEGVIEQMQQNQNIIFAGIRKDVEFIYPLMNVFSLPSHNFREGFGNVCMEASASGIPIIVTRGAGCQDAVIDGVTGFLIDAKKPQQLANAIEKYINSADLAKLHGDNGVAFANKYFKNEVIWEAQYAFYKDLIDL